MLRNAARTIRGFPQDQEVVNASNMSGSMASARAPIPSFFNGLQCVLFFSSSARYLQKRKLRNSSQRDGSLISFPLQELYLLDIKIL